MAKSNFDDIIVKYKKELTTVKSGENIELEVRFKHINYDKFSIIYNQLLSTTKPENIFITQSINVLTSQNTNKYPLIPSTTNIKYYQYDNEFKKVSKPKYLSKTSLMTPFNENNTYMPYKISLSLEKNIDEFISDSRSTIRVKNRVSFTIADNIVWRIDMTIVREIQSNNITSIETALTTLVNKMFRENIITPQNMLTIFNERNMSHAIYKYEIEAELINTEYLKSSDILNIIKKITSMVDNNYTTHIDYNQLMRIISVDIHGPIGIHKEFVLKRMLPSVITFSKADYNSMYPLTNYYVTDKADGVRAIGMCIGTLGYIITNTVQVIDSKYKQQDSEPRTITDGELVDGILYIFDVITIRDEVISYNPFENRITYLNLAAIILRDAGINVQVKEYMKINNNIKEVVNKIYNAPHPYKIDGLIFVQPPKYGVQQTYSKTYCYKWKRIEDTTIDFLVKKAPRSILGTNPFISKPGYTLYFLFVGISNTMFQIFNLHTCLGYSEIFNNMNIKDSQYFPIQFCPSTAPLSYVYYHPNDNDMDINDNIVEFRCSTNCSSLEGPLIGWEPIKIRTDRKKDLESQKYYGNDFKIAEITWNNYLDPFPLEHLWMNVSEDYFASNKISMYDTQTSVLSFIKSRRISSYENQEWVLDIGCGKGQDLGRYFDAGIKNLIAIDSDKAALAELIRRKYSPINLKKIKKTNVYALLVDMRTDVTESLLRIKDLTNIPENYINTIISNLSIHYYIYTDELLNNFISFVNSLLRPSGHLAITCFFGERVFELLKTLQEGQTWTVYENGVVKYSIKKLYSSSKLEHMGQKIGVILPFSRGEYYEEYLVNTKYLSSELKKYGYSQISSKIVSDSLDEFKLANPERAKNLTKDDITYLSLYGELLYQKK